MSQWQPAGTNTWSLPRESTRTVRDSVPWADDVPAVLAPSETVVPGVDAAVRIWLVVALLLVIAILALTLIPA